MIELEVPTTVLLRILNICKIKFCLSAMKFKILRFWLYMTFADLKLKLWYKKAHFMHVHNSIYFPVHPFVWGFLVWNNISRNYRRKKFYCTLYPFFPVHFNVLSIWLTFVGGMDCTIKVWDIRKGVASSSSQWVHSTQLHY